MVVEMCSVETDAHGFVHDATLQATYGNSKSLYLSSDNWGRPLLIIIFCSDTVMKQ